MVEEHSMLPFFNAHTHVAMFPMRNSGEGLSLHDWLSQKMWPAEEKLSEEDVYFASVLSLVEMVRFGVAGLHDLWWKFPEQVLKAVEDVGLVGAVAIDMARNSEDSAREFLELKSRIIRAVGVQSIYSADGETIKKAYSLAEEYSVPFHIHVSETREELFYSLENFGLRPIEYLDKLGVLSHRTVLAHGSWASVREIAIVASSGAWLVHCPVSNLKLATGGICPVKEYEEKGARIALGTDGPASNNSLNMAETLKVAALLQKHKYWDATQGNPSLFLKYATENGFCSVGLEPSGNLTIKLEENLLPAEELDTALVYSLASHNILSLEVGGELLLKEGRLSKRLERLKEQALDHFGL